ncbi:MAG: hypothetical protein ACKOSS_07130, partial [Planctomycetia bacterium]
PPVVAPRLPPGARTPLAYSPRGSSGRPSSRGGSGGSRGGGRSGGGGGNNALPAVIAGVVIVGLIGAFGAMSGGSKKAPPPAPPAAPPPVAAAPVGPKGPVLGPKPNLPADIVTRAKALMPRIKVEAEKGAKLREQAMAAKKANDQDKWQALLDEAREVYKTVRDEWISIEDEVSEFLSKHPSTGWDENMLMDAYLKVESREVQRLIDEPLSGMAKTGRGH